MFTLRYDMRAPGGGAPARELYGAALEMAAWAETRGAVMAVLSEHHASPDGYLPSPTAMAAAMAARTTSLSISVMVTILPLHDPVQLAEELCVIDLISCGRVSWVAGIGYRPEEYELFGVDFSRRGSIAEEKLAVLLRARTGEEFERFGRTVRVTPAPFTDGGPPVAWGGGSVAAARRAGRHGLDFFAQRDGDGLREAYESSARAAGHQPGVCFLPPPDMPTTVFVSEDPDRAWHELGPYLMHDALAYAEWNRGTPGSASMSSATTPEELRRANASHRVVTPDQARELIARDGILQLHPLVGGLPPELAWPYLEAAAALVTGS